MCIRLSYNQSKFPCPWCLWDNAQGKWKHSLSNSPTATNILHIISSVYIMYHQYTINVLYDQWRFSLSCIVKKEYKYTWIKVNDHLFIISYSLGNIQFSSLLSKDKCYRISRLCQSNMHSLSYDRSCLSSSSPTEGR